MDPPAGTSPDRRGNGPSAGAAPSGLRRYGLNFSASSLLQAPLAALLEYSGVVPSGPAPQAAHHRSAAPSSPSSASEVDGLLSAAAAGNGEVSIRIQGGPGDSEAAGVATTGTSSDDSIEVTASTEVDQASAVGRGAGAADAEANGGGGGASGNGGGDRGYQRYDVHHVARWIEQILPFSLLLLVVFIRQHLQGFFVTIWIAAVMFKSNDILRKQTALKILDYQWTTRICIYETTQMDHQKWTTRYTMVRQAAMAVKCVLLMYYKNCRGRNYRRQKLDLIVLSIVSDDSPMLPVSLGPNAYPCGVPSASLSCVIANSCLVQSFLAAVKALSRKDVHYGSYATAEQVLAAGDMCAICQEKMHVPVLLRCKHIFCEDCVSEWFERERTCPLCRALVKPADIRSFGDGSTSLFFQLF
nr:unnamed protein product [Digitaria exilis]